MKVLSTLIILLALGIHGSSFAQGKPKAKPKTNTTNSGNTNKTTGTSTTTPNVVVPPPSNTNTNTSNNNTTTTTPSNNTQKNTAAPSVGGTTNKLGGSTLSPEEEARLVCSPISMGYSAFEVLKSNVAGISSDSAKIATIQTEVQGKKLSISQVRNLLNLLQKDIKRLELAKYLLDYTCNKSQYSSLADMLLANHVKEFNDYINSKDLTDSSPLVRDGN